MNLDKWCNNFCRDTGFSPKDEKYRKIFKREIVKPLWELRKSAFKYRNAYFVNLNNKKCNWLFDEILKDNFKMLDKSK